MDATAPGPERPGGLLALYERIIRFAAGSMMTVIVVVMTVQVIMRYVFGSSLIWAEELCRYILIWMTFLLLGMSYQKGEFVTLDMFPASLPVAARRVLRIVMAIPVLVFLALMVWAGWNYAGRFQHQTIPALDFIWTSITGGPLHLSIRWVYISVSVGSGLLFLHILVDLCLRAWRLASGAPDTNDTDPASGESA